MLNPEEEKILLNQIFKLVQQLSPESRGHLLEQLRLEELRHEIQIGIDQADRGELIPAEEILAKLRKRAELRLKETQTK